jgi:hypothetical protein
LDISFEDSGRGSWADLDLDGDWDLIVLSGDGVTFFENRSQNFLNKTGETGLSDVGGAWDSCWGDFDGDKDPDLYLIRSGFLGEGNNQLLQNRGGMFRDVTEQWGLLGRRATSRALFVDFDGDGQQDLLEVGNLSSEHAALRLFRNEGSNFREISVQLGLEFEGNAVDCAVEDYDLDGDDDLFVLRWRRPAILFRNESGSLFRDVTGECGLSDVGGNGYSALFLDYDGDGRPDLLVTRLARFEMAADCLLNPGCIQSEETPRLFRNAGQDRFEEVTGEIGLTIPFGTIQAVSSDFNSDGWPDLLIANGSLEPTRHEPGRILLNDQGLGFKDAGFLPGFRPINALGVSVAEISGGKGHDVYIAGVGLFGIRASSLPERLHR